MNKNDFYYLSEGMENCKMSGKSGKSQGILKWMISDNPVTATNQKQVSSTI